MTEDFDRLNPLKQLAYVWRDSVVFLALIFSCALLCSGVWIALNSWTYDYGWQWRVGPVLITLLGGAYLGVIGFTLLKNRRVPASLWWLSLIALPLLIGLVLLLFTWPGYRFD